jgi:hypothetical protein
MNFMADQVAKFLDPAPEPDILDELLSDPDFITQKREYDVKRLQRETRGAIPLPADFKPKIFWHEQVPISSYIQKSNDGMEIDEENLEDAAGAKSKSTGGARTYINQVDEIRNMLDRLLVNNDAGPETSSTHLVVEIDQFDLLAHRTRRQTFLYAFLELLAVSPNQISVVLQTSRSDAFTLLEKRVASRLPQRQIIIEPPHKLESLISLYQYWLHFPAEEIDARPILGRWNDSVATLLSSALVVQELTNQLQAFNSIFYYQNHVDILLASLPSDLGAAPALLPQSFAAPFECYLSGESMDQVGQSLSRVELIVLAAARNLEMNLREQQLTYSFEDIFLEYDAILQMAESGLVESMRQVLRRYRVSRHTALRAFENLLDCKFFQYRGTGRAIGATATIHLSLQYRPVRSCLTLVQLDSIIRSRRNELDFLKSMKF